VKDWIDAEYVVLDEGRRPLRDRPARKELPGWFKALVFTLAALTLAFSQVERVKQVHGQPSLLDRPTAQAPQGGPEPWSAEADPPRP
jgi:hypothetical protein